MMSISKNVVVCFIIFFVVLLTVDIVCTDTVTTGLFKSDSSNESSDEHLLKFRHKKGKSDSSDEDGVVDSIRDATGENRLGFLHGFLASLSVILVSELGDKTFFIAAIMAMRHSRITVFVAAISALVVMTILSAILGYATTIIPRNVTFYASSAMFAIFGLKMLKDGFAMSNDEGQEEYEEVQADLKKREEERQRKADGIEDVETGIIRTPGRRWFQGILSAIFLQAFTLTFLAEWGDRSQITTIILAAREDVYGVILGGALGHSICTSIAVVGGRIVAQKISVRTVTLIGGVVFILFALSALVLNP